MTEEDAKTKWCPFARVSCANTPETGNHAANRNAVMLDEAPSLTAGSQCVGSRCMAWRGQYTPEFHAMVKEHFRTTGIWLKPTPKDTEGHCGLAGKP